MSRLTDQLKNPKFLLLYSPLQFSPGEIAKPDGSLSLLYLAGALRRHGYDVRIFDCAVGDESFSIEDSFENRTAMTNGLIRVGVSVQNILKIVEEFDVIGISSIFTAQTTPVLQLIDSIRALFPSKIIITGGVNARSMRDRFFKAGVDLIALSESERTIVQIADSLHNGRGLIQIPGTAYQSSVGCEVMIPSGPLYSNLDDLPLPAWDMLPLNRYWDISRPHGGNFASGKRIKYASLQTSRGCPFKCSYCHISKEGDARRYRIKSIARVMEELDILKKLGVEYVYLEDDSLFAKKHRAYELMKMVRETGLILHNVNGINLCHLLERNGTSYNLDHQFLEVFAEANLQFLTLPFESASQRIIDRYASAKLQLDRFNTKDLFKICDQLKINVSGNYMIGYPDETLVEIQETFMMARQHVDQGMTYASLFAVVPFPGTDLFEMAIATGQLNPDFNPDEMRWTKSILKGLAVNNDTLENMRQLAWLLINRPSYVSYKKEMLVDV